MARTNNKNEVTEFELRDGDVTVRTYAGVKDVKEGGATFYLNWYGMVTRFWLRQAKSGRWFISFPSYKDSDGDYHDNVYIVDKDDFTELLELLKTEYNLSK